MARAYLSLGSNLGDRRAMLEGALAALEASGHLTVVKRSSIYETEPVGFPDQPWFYNLAAEVDTVLSPEELLNLTKRVEQEMERTREIRWGPRTIDIDLLLYDGLELATDRLTIPHPEMTGRRFVLEPLHEIAPDLTLSDGRSIEHLLKVLRGQEVRRVTERRES